MDQKIIVITGGSKGLGKELARILVEQNNKVIICSRHKSEIEKAASEVDATAFTTDVSDPGDIDTLTKFTIKTFGRIDIWINNAGVWLPHAPIEELNLGRLQDLFKINIFGLINCCKSALIEMRRQNSGTIVNINSTSGLIGRPNSAGYAASKWAVRGFTESLRAECNKSNIHIIGVYPGGMKTDFFNEKKPATYDAYMDPMFVARKIIENLNQNHPEEELIIKRPS